MKLLLVLSSLTLSLSIAAQAMQENTKGLLPEVRLDAKNEDKNQEKAFQSEVLITKSENKAIEALTRIIAKKKGSAEEPDLLFRLAELYMRRAKSGRFFDLSQTTDLQLTKVGITNQKSQAALKSAIQVYNRIEKEYPKYKGLDAVYFNNALAHLQTKQTERAKSLYDQLIASFPKSTLVSDALLEVGEIYYFQQNFTTALDKFKAIEKFPASKAYPYGLYKSAWCHYNLKQTDQGVHQLLAVVRQNPAGDPDAKKYNLRKEALRDLTLFVGETLAPEQLFSFFEKITTEEELGESMMALSQLFESHSRFSEINIFVKEFIDKHPSSPQAVKCYAKLIDVNETLKLRPQVLVNLKKMAEFCQAQVHADCKTNFRSASLEISKKWWDIWLKNKKNTEFSKLTEQAFEILLSNDDLLKPDSKSRYAYAELLFQQGKFEQASKNYEEVANHQGLDKTLAHDALYGALYSVEKQLELKDDSVEVERQKTLAAQYVKNFENGEHIVSIKYKLGFIAYKQADYDLALKSLLPLTKKSKFPEIKVKSEDIVLDIYNIQKDFKLIQSFAKNLVKDGVNDRRTKNLTKIIEEANYSQIQAESENLPALKRIDQLRLFAKEYSTSKLGQDAFWQSISLAYSNGYDVMGAELSLAYVKQYPQDKRKVDATKEAVKAFIDAGQLKQAIPTLRELAQSEPAQGFKHLELSCDLQRINDQLPEARGCYKALFEKADKNKRVDLLAKMMRTFKDAKSSAELESIQNQILKDNIEPYATTILIAQAKAFLADQKYTQAFNLSLKINARPVDADARAEARLIQAAVLEKEFVSQSVKARENKFAMVLSLKTEKLDKAYTAYSTTIKMSKSDKIQVQALQGIDRLYANFIEALTNMPVPTSLTPDEQKTLRVELVKMSQPFKQKQIDNLAQLRKISQLSTGTSESVNWAEVSVEKTIEPRLQFPAAKKLSSFFPSSFLISKDGYTRLPASEKKCDVQSLTASSVGGCIQTKKYDDAEALAFKLTATKENRAMGLYYLSVLADKKDHSDKALWMIEKALALDPENSVLNYQKGKVLYSVEGINSALPFFEKILDMKKTSPDLVVMSAVKSFSDRDYISATEEFSRLSNDELYTYGMGLLYVEAAAQKGETAQALRLASTFLNWKPDYVDMFIEQARVQEHFALNKEGAIVSYQKALSKSANADQKDWLKRKIEFLKNNNNQITSYVGG
ncbi:MAG: tetratricopeptide repeat protein [Bdellovibrio sp.]|nr:tetratricopeptide repeat protein [Bdellovibrio sp.]